MSDEIPDTLLSALARTPVIDETEIEGFLAARGCRERAADSLTVREIEVLRYLARGLTREQTADAMAYSFETVKDWLKSARFKLRAKNSTHACCEALRRGMIT